jgi:hypothetical protein
MPRAEAYASPAVSQCPRYGEAVSRRCAAELDDRARAAELPADLVRRARPPAPRAVDGARPRASPNQDLSGGHGVVDIPRCRVPRSLTRSARRRRSDPHDGRDHAEARTGALRAVQVVVERAGRTAQLVLVGNAATRTARRVGGALGDGSVRACTASGGTGIERQHILGPH